MWKWLVRILVGLVGVIALAILVSLGLYQHWLSGQDRALVRNSTVVETARGPIEYAQFGQGPAVLVSHGTPGGYDGELAVLRLTRAPEPGFHFILPSRPGYLRTPLQVGRTPQEQADAFAALLDSLHLRKVAIIASSGGGPAALQFALRHPERCSALVLESALIRNYRGPAARLPPSPFAARVRDTLFYLFQNVGIAPYQRKAPNDPLIAPIARAELYGIMPYWPRRQGAENDLIQEQHLDGWPLENIRCPTLIVQGTLDESVPLADARFAHEKIPDSNLTLIPGADHMMSITQHGQVDEIVTAFLRAHS